MRDYLGEKQASEFLCRKLRKTYQDMGLKDVKVWVEPFEFSKTVYWSIRSNLTKKYPELFNYND
jgi:hypothetical protein